MICLGHLHVARTGWPWIFFASCIVVCLDVVECVWNLMAHGDAREGKWRGNWRMDWVASTLTLPRNVLCPALLTLVRTPRLPAVDWIDAPADLNGLVHFGERWNLVSARVPSRFKHSLLTSHLLMPYKEHGTSQRDCLTLCRRIYKLNCTWRLSPYRERRNLVSARVPSRFKHSLLTSHLLMLYKEHGTSQRDCLTLSRRIYKLNCTWRPSPYRAVNTLRLGYKNQPVKVV